MIDDTIKQHLEKLESKNKLTHRLNISPSTLNGHSLSDRAKRKNQ